MQTKAFEALGISDEDIQERFGHLVNAFQYGAPPTAAGLRPGPAGDAHDQGPPRSGMSSPSPRSRMPPTL